jgi:hypothetical protein
MCAITELVDALALSMQQLTCYKASFKHLLQSRHTSSSSPLMNLSVPNFCAANKAVVEAVFEKATGGYVCERRLDSAYFRRCREIGFSSWRSL